MSHPPADGFPLAARAAHPMGSVVHLRDGLAVGDGRVVVIAGPCAVEDERQVMAAAHAVREAGATIFRAGAWKPRTSPYAFQGLGAPALKLLRRVRQETGLLVVTEAMDEEALTLAAEAVDIVQIGSRNMQNFSLLRAAGRLRRPVLLKRGAAATIPELLLAAEYILAEGNPDVILCERGIRGFGNTTRNTLDLSAIPAVKQLSHLPIIADPSHGTGHRDLVPAMARAAVAAGADGVMIEVHPFPDTALSDGEQSLGPAAFAALMAELRPLGDALGRPLVASHPVAA
ncbi:MAG: 3-deoxy-7-phosphoheptulonate synthase [Gemmatimonadales bacterium]